MKGEKVRQCCRNFVEMYTI